MEERLLTETEEQEINEINYEENLTECETVGSYQGGTSNGQVSEQVRKRDQGRADDAEIRTQDSEVWTFDER